MEKKKTFLGTTQPQNLPIGVFVYSMYVCVSHALATYYTYNVHYFTIQSTVMTQLSHRLDKSIKQSGVQETRIGRARQANFGVLKGT